MSQNQSWKEYIARKMRPYGEELMTFIRVRASDRENVGPWGRSKIPLADWKRMKRTPKKRARRKAKEEIAEVLQENAA